MCIFFLGLTGAAQAQIRFCEWGGAAAGGYMRIDVANMEVLLPTLSLSLLGRRGDEGGGACADDACMRCAVMGMGSGQM